MTEELQKFCRKKKLNTLDEQLASQGQYHLYQIYWRPKYLYIC